MNYPQDFLNKITGLGTLGYSLGKILNVLDIPDDQHAQFLVDFDDAASPIARAYQRGVDKADYVIDMALFEAAKNGDLKAIEKYESRKKQEMAREIKSRESRMFENTGL